MRLGALEMVIILAVVILIFGPKQLPKVAVAVRNSIHELRKDGEEDAEESLQEER